MTNNDDDRVEKYRNKVTEVLANFLPSENAAKKEANDVLGSIDFDAPKLSTKLDLDILAAVLDAELYEKEWFVTGNVNPIYFSNDFKFQDPDVKIDGIEGRLPWRAQTRWRNKDEGKINTICPEKQRLEENGICTFSLKVVI